MNLHRNNAAEWIMWACLLPVFCVAWLIDRVKRSATNGTNGHEYEEFIRDHS